MSLIKRKQYVSVLVYLLQWLSCITETCLKDALLQFIYLFVCFLALLALSFLGILWASKSRKKKHFSTKTFLNICIQVGQSTGMLWLALSSHSKKPVVSNLPVCVKFARSLCACVGFTPGALISSRSTKTRRLVQTTALNCT